MKKIVLLIGFLMALITVTTANAAGSPKISAQSIKVLPVDQAQNPSQCQKLEGWREYPVNRMEWTPENSQGQAIGQPVRLRWDDVNQLPQVYNNASSYNTRWFQASGMQAQSINVVKMAIVEYKTSAGTAQLILYPLRNQGELVVYATETKAGNCYVH